MIEVYMWTDGTNKLTQSLVVHRDGRLLLSKELDHNRRNIEIGSISNIGFFFSDILKLKLVKI